MRKHSRFTSALLILGLTAAISPIPVGAAGPLAHASTQIIQLDGKPVELQAYALADANGNLTNYVKLRDIAYLLNGTGSQFQVGWNGAVEVTTGQSYTPDGSEMHTPFSGDRTYSVPATATRVDGREVSLDAIFLTDDAGGGYTYYKLRDLGAALDFTVGWSGDRGIYLETAALSYVSLDDAGTYDTALISDSLLSKDSDLPQVTQQALPTTWRGAGIASRKYSVDEYKAFAESDVRFLAENGFNFTRLYLSFETLRYPDFPQDPRMVSQRELRDLDQLLAWCMEYDVHLQIAMNDYLNADGTGKGQGEGMPQSEEEWVLVREYWTMLARRYAGIPSRYLSFDLCNESEPKEGDGQLETCRQELSALVSSIRAVSPDRVLLYSQPDRENLEWTEAVASLGVAIGCHVYTPSGALLGHREVEGNPDTQMIWPLPYFPVGLVGDGRAKITLTGQVDNSELRFHLEKSGKSPVVAVYADGTLLERMTLEGTLGEKNDYFHDGYYSVSIPAGVKKVELKVERDILWLSTLILDREGVQTVMVPSDAYGARDLTAPAPLVIQGDGTYTNTEHTYCDADWIYEHAVQPVQEIAERYGVGFMINEFGVAANRVNWDIETVNAYHQTYLEMMDRYDLGWCFLEISNRFPKHFVILDGTESQWAGATVEEVTYTYDDGSTETIRVCKELTEVFRRYNEQQSQP